jgi:hypothetical protein
MAGDEEAKGEPGGKNRMELVEIARQNAAHVVRLAGTSNVNAFEA